MHKIRLPLHISSDSYAFLVKNRQVNGLGHVRRCTMTPSQTRPSRRQVTASMAHERSRKQTRLWPHSMPQRKLKISGRYLQQKISRNSDLYIQKQEIGCTRIPKTSKPADLITQLWIIANHVEQASNQFPSLLKRSSSVHSGTYPTNATVVGVSIDRR